MNVINSRHEIQIQYLEDAIGIVDVLLILTCSLDVQGNNSMININFIERSLFYHLIPIENYISDDHFQYITRHLIGCCFLF